jgi:hypothetical protein
MSLSPGFCKNVSGVTAVLWALVTVCESGCIFSKSSRGTIVIIFIFTCIVLYSIKEKVNKIRLIKFDSLKTNKFE